MMSLFFLNSIDFDDENARRTSGKVVENLFSQDIYVHLNAMQCNAIKCNQKSDFNSECLILNLKKNLYKHMFFLLITYIYLHLTIPDILMSEF